MSYTQGLARLLPLVHTVPNRLSWMLVYIYGTPASINRGIAHAGYWHFSVDLYRLTAVLTHWCTGRV